MAWTIEYTAVADRQLRKLNPKRARLILDYLDQRIATADNPRQFGHALVGNYAGYWRYRVDDMRIICQIFDGRLAVLVVKIGRRDSIYGD